MKKNYLEILFVNIFCLALIVIPGYWISLRGNYLNSSFIEGRDLSTFNRPSYQNLKRGVKLFLQGNSKAAGETFFNQFLDRSFQKNFEAAAADQFPSRITAIQIAESFQRGMINLAYLFLSDGAVPVDAQSNIDVTRDSSRLIFAMRLFSPETQAVINTRIKNYADLIRLYPKQKFYLFYFQRLFESKYHPLVADYNNPDSGKSYQYFKDNKPDGLIFGDLLLSGLEDHFNYFYRTDHHWNIRGACRAYLEIYKMLVIGYPAISPVLKCDEFITVPNVMFLGSLARQSLYPVQAEKFEIANVKLPPYRVISNGKVTYHDQNPQNLTTNSSSNPYTNYYDVYFGVNTPLEEYIFENGSHRNAIIISDSYVHPIAPYLAYHYNHTYFVDFRGYNNFSLGDLLKKYQVDDVIVIGDNVVAFTDEGWIINP